MSKGIKASTVDKFEFDLFSYTIISKTCNEVWHDTERLSTFSNLRGVALVKYNLFLHPDKQIDELRRVANS